MACWTCQESLSAMENEELRALCEHRDLKEGKKKRKSKEERVKLLMKCETEPNYNKLHKNELEIEMKARGLAVSRKHKVQELKDILNNFTNLQSYQLNSQINESIDMCEDLFECCHHSYSKLKQICKELKKYDNNKEQSKIISILDKENIDYGDICNLEKNIIETATKLKQFTRFIEFITDTEKATINDISPNRKDNNNNNKNNSKNEMDDDDKSNENSNENENENEDIDIDNSNNEKEEAYIVWNEKSTQYSIDNVVAIFDNLHDANKCAKKYPNWKVEKFIIIDKI